MAWAPAYATTAELAAFVRVDDGNDDAQLALAIAAASRAIDRTTRRQFGLVDAPEARYYTAFLDRQDRWVVEVDDLMTSTGLAVAFDEEGDNTYSTAITEFVTDPRNAAALGRPWTRLVVLAASDTQPTDTIESLEITGQWGWSSVPDAVKQACLLQASRLLSRRNSPYGVAGSPQVGSELRLLAKVDPDVEVSLADYRRRPRRVVFA